MLVVPPTPGLPPVSPLPPVTAVAEKPPVELTPPVAAAAPVADDWVAELTPPLATPPVVDEVALYDCPPDAALVGRDDELPPCPLVAFVPPDCVEHATLKTSTLPRTGNTRHAWINMICNV